VGAIPGATHGFGLMVFIFKLLPSDEEVLSSGVYRQLLCQRESEGLFEAFGQGQGRLGVRHVFVIVIGGSNGCPLILGRLVVTFDLLCHSLAQRRRRRSFEGYKGIIVVAGRATVEDLVVGSLRVVQLHWTAVVAAEIAIINCSMVCINSALWGRLLLVGRVLRAVGPRVLCQFVREGVDRAQHLAIALGLFIA
jgi:hypothetical protein